MREAELFLALVQRSGGDLHADQGRVFGPVVASDDVAKTIVELPEAPSGFGRELAIGKIPQRRIPTGGRLCHLRHNILPRSILRGER